MNKVIQELQRRYFLPNQQCRHGPLASQAEDGPLTPELIAKSLQGETAVALKLVSADNQVRALVIRFETGDGWSRLAELYQYLQGNLGLPALAVSVSGKGGFQLWFSLADSIPLLQAQTFLHELQRKYLSDLSPSSVTLAPCIDGAGKEQVFADLAPAFNTATERWSAFIDPSLGSMFIDEPGLEIAPNLETQADILAGFESIKAEDFQRALALLQSLETAPLPASQATTAPASNAGPDIGTDYKDPQSFLLAVMNSSSASLDQRIMAATALLAHLESPSTK
jgi:hypothetical protein